MDTGTSFRADQLIRQLQKYPNYQDVEPRGSTRSRLQAVLKNLHEDEDDQDVCEQETIFRLDFTSWLYFKLEEKDKAGEINEQVLERTNWTNMMSISMRAFLSWENGEEAIADECNQRLKKLEASSRTVAKAEQAYTYGKIGGPWNLWKAIQTFEEVVKETPNNYFWKIQLGFIYGRTTHGNIYSGMPQEIGLEDCLIRAVKHLMDVCDHAESNLRGPAFAELAALYERAYFVVGLKKREQIFGRMTCKSLCTRALGYGQNSAWILTYCGKALRRSDVDQAIELFKRAAEIRPHTTVFHQLGLCYKDKAKYKRSTPRSLNPSSSHSQPDSARYLDLAREAYKKAIELSSVNAPALFNLGLLYESAGNVDKALKTFNQITNSSTIPQGHLITLLAAYEHAGLCCRRIKGMEKFAEEKLLKAIALAADLVSKIPDLRDYSSKIWRSFHIFKADLEKKRSSSENDKKLIKLLQLMEEHGEAIEVVKKHLTLPEDNLDPEIIRSGLKSYLKLHQYDNALAFLNMARTRPNLIDTWKTPGMSTIHKKVLLHAAKEHIQQRRSGEVILLFQELFCLFYRSCKSETQSDFPGDVLFVCDETASQEHVQKLQQIFNSLFGLGANRNLQGCVKFGVKFELQLQEMRRYPLVILVLADERSNEFKALLQMVPTVALNSSSGSPTFLVLDTRQSHNDVIDVLGQYRSMKLQDMVPLDDLLKAPRDGAVDESEEDVVTNVFRGNIDSVLQLFCFIIGQQWPLP